MESYGVKDIIKILEGDIKRHSQPMPKFDGYKEAEPTTSEHLQIQYEKDVFESTLNEDKLLQRILQDNELKIQAENPLRGESYYTPVKLSKKEKDLLDYILADRTLRDDAAFTIHELPKHLDAKADGLNRLMKQNKEEYKQAQARELQDINEINNRLINKIMIKREQLQTRLRMLEEIDAVYQKEASKEQMATPVGLNTKFDFLGSFEQWRSSELKSEKTRYKGKNKKFHRMDEIVLSLENEGKIDKQTKVEFEELAKELEDKHQNNVTFHLIKLHYGLGLKDAKLTAAALEDTFKAANTITSEGVVENMIPLNVSVCKKIFELFIEKDHFKGLGQLINYLEDRRLSILPFNLSLFRDAIDYYQNQIYSPSNILIYLKFYTYYQKCLFNHYGLTPEKINTLDFSGLVNFSHLLFQNTNYVDTGYLIKRLDGNKIIDRHTRKDVLKGVVEYFVDYTVPFMDMPHVSPG